MSSRQTLQCREALHAAFYRPLGEKKNVYFATEAVASHSAKTLQLQELGHPNSLEKNIYVSNSTCQV